MPFSRARPPIQAFCRRNYFSSASSSSASSINSQGAGSRSSTSAVSATGQMSHSSEQIFTPGATSSHSYASASAFDNEITTTVSVDTTIDAS